MLLRQGCSRGCPPRLKAGQRRGIRASSDGWTPGGYEMSITVDIARYTATDAIVEGHGSQHPAGGRDTQGRALFEQLSKLLEHLCALWSSAATDSAAGPPRSTCPTVVTTSPSSTT